MENEDFCRELSFVLALSMCKTEEEQLNLLRNAEESE